MSKTPVSFSRKDFVKSFKRKHSKLKLPESEINILIDHVGMAIADILIEDGEIKLGSRLGPLLIRKCKPKGRGGSFMSVLINHRKSLDQKKKIYQFNDHSDGFIYKFIWNKRLCKSIRDKHMWVFKPIRSLKRRLAPVIRNNEVEYPLMIEHIRVLTENQSF